MRLEAQHITEQEWSKLGVADKLRTVPLVAPFVVFWYCYIGKGLWLDGRLGLYYALQRMLAECVLVSRSRQFDGREIEIIDGLPDWSSRISIEAAGTGTGKPRRSPW